MLGRGFQFPKAMAYAAYESSASSRQAQVKFLLNYDMPTSTFEYLRLGSMLVLLPKLAMSA